MKQTLRDYLKPLPKKEKQEIARHVLLGLPFYGYDNRSALVGKQYLDVLRENTVSIRFNAKWREHETVYRDASNRVHSIFYPTLQFLQDRIDLAEKVKCGIGIWELGQGLDNFMDLLSFVS